MQHLANLLEKKYAKELPYVRAIGIIQSHWHDVVKELTRCMYPKGIYNNQLLIECNNPIWMSEIDCFKDSIILNVNQLLTKHKIKVKIKGIKALVNIQMGPCQVLKKKNTVPASMNDRIQWNIKNKQKYGAQLCEKCEKVWDSASICRLCRLTGQ